MSTLEEQLQTLETLKEIGVPFIRKLGHRVDVWELGSNPKRRLCYSGICNACGKQVSFQRTLVAIARKVSYRWEITAGSYVVGTTQNDDLLTLTKTENNLCKRYLNME